MRVYANNKKSNWMLKVRKAGREKEGEEEEEEEKEEEEEEEEE